MAARNGKGKFHIFSMDDTIVLTFDQRMAQGLHDILEGAELEGQEYALLKQLEGLINDLPVYEEEPKEEKAA